MLKYTLVGYEGSESARRSFEFAMALMRATGGRVRVVWALQVTEGGSDAAALMMTDSGAGRSAELLAELTTLAADAPTMVDIDIVYGSPGDVLLAQVQQYGIDHIVIGHTDRGTLLRWLLGSVSSEIIARAHVPVTVVR